MGLVEFIFDNLFLVIVALWVIFSVFARGQKQAGNRQNTETRPTSRPSGQWEAPQQHSYPQQPKPSEVVSPELQQMRDKIDHLRHEQQASAKKLNVHDHDLEEQKLDQESPFSNQSLGQASVQGMMWKEVFGPPRSKDPYRMGRRTHR